MSNTITIPGIWRFFGALNYKERNDIQRQMNVSIAEVMGNPNHPLADELALHLTYKAARRLNRDEITMDSLEEMTVAELDPLLREIFAAAGYPDQEIEVDDDGVPLVMQDSATTQSSSDSKLSETSDTENSLTSTTDASNSAGA